MKREKIERTLLEKEKDYIVAVLHGCLLWARLKRKRLLNTTITTIRPSRTVRSTANITPPDLVRAFSCARLVGKSFESFVNKLVCKTFVCITLAAIFRYFPSLILLFVYKITVTVIH